MRDRCSVKFASGQQMIIDYGEDVAAGLLLLLSQRGGGGGGVQARGGLPAAGRGVGPQSLRPLQTQPAAVPGQKSRQGKEES